MFTIKFFVIIAVRFTFCTGVDYNKWSVKAHALFPTLPIAAPWSNDTQCREESRLLMESLENKTFWAMKMWDSSAKTEIGHLYGNVYQGGNFDECLSVRGPIQVRFCGVKIRAHVNESFQGDDPFEIDPNPFDSVWKKFIDTRIDPSKYPRDTAMWGLCVPASCSPQEMLTSIRLHLRDINFQNDGSVRYDVSIGRDYCQKLEDLDFSPGEIGFWAFSATLMFLVIISTVLDFLASFGTHSRGKQLLLSFSLKQNVPKLLSKKMDKSSEKFKILHFLKFMCTVFVIIGHRNALMFAGPVTNYQVFEEHSRTLTSAIVTQGEAWVDIFFACSGILVCYFMLEKTRENSVNPVLLIFGRFLRLAPPYYFMIWFHATVLYRLGSGPIWPALKPEVEFCQANWWTNVLFVNNYVNVDSSCMSYTWFIACDFHLFIIATFVTLLIQKDERKGICLLAFLTVAFLLIPGIITYVYKLTPVVMYYHRNLGTSIRNDLTRKLLYIPTHSRGFIYFTGMIIGYVIFKNKDRAKQISPVLSLAGFIAALALLFGPIIYAGKAYYNPRRHNNIIESAFFTSTRKLLAGIAYCIFMFTNAFGSLFFVKLIEKISLYIPLSRITYSIYLVHFYMIAADIAKAKIPKSFGIYDIIVSSAADVVMSVIYGVILYLLVELPAKMLFHELLFKKIGKNQDSKIEEELNHFTIIDNFYGASTAASAIHLSDLSRKIQQ